MRLFRYFLRVPRARKRVLRACLQSLDIAIEVALPQMQEEIPCWDLENPKLLVSLGYIFGYIDAAYQSALNESYDKKFVESVFCSAIERYMGKLPGVEAYVKLRWTSPDGSLISLLQLYSEFMSGALKGGGDFVRFANEARLPLSLAEFFLD